jgi:hypothetical protein
MSELKYRLLSRLGIWATGIYKDNEQVDWHVRQTPIRKFLNWFWSKINNYRYGDPCPPKWQGDLAEVEHLPEKMTWRPLFFKEEEQ